MSNKKTQFSYLLILLSLLFQACSPSKKISSPSKSNLDRPCLLDVANSNLNWSGKAGDSNYTLSGNIKAKSGDLKFKDGILEAALLVDMTSMAHEIPSLIGHLKSPDFFDVSKYKTAKFTISNQGLKTCISSNLPGNFTIKGKESQEMVNINLCSSTADTYTCTFKTAIDRTKYGIDYNSTTIYGMEIKNPISDTIWLSGDLIFNKQD